MNNIVVVYKSKYGSTKKYAQWISEALQCDMIEGSKATVQDVRKYDTVIYGGGVYASGIAGISFIKKNVQRLKGKKIIVFAVGASPYDEKMVKAMREKIFTGDLTQIPSFYYRGGWDEDAMSFKDKMLCNLLKKAVAKKDPAAYEPWEQALMEAIGSKTDWTNKEYLKDLLACASEQ